MTDERFDLESMRQFLLLLHGSNAVIELRGLGLPRGGVASGYFDSIDTLIKAAGLSGGAAGCYITMNPVDPATLARAANRLVERPAHTTSDGDVPCRTHLLIDLDPSRPSGTASSEREHTAALLRARDIADFLTAAGWPDPLLIDSGNGAALFYAINLPNTPDSTSLVSRCLDSLDWRFSDEVVRVDPSVSNASRLCRLVGTLNKKGDALADRPHRLARIVQAPDRLAIVSADQLGALAALLPPTPRPARRDPKGEHTAELDVDVWLSEHGLTVARSAPWSSGGHKWILDRCPWNPAHTDKSAYVVRLPSGALGAGCHHASCTGLGWPELRAAFSRNGGASQAGGGPMITLLPGGNQKETAASHLVRLALDCTLFHTPSGEAFALAPVGDHWETLAVRSQTFRLWLTSRLFAETQAAEGQGRAASSEALNAALNSIEGQARFVGETHPVYVRVAAQDSVVYLDLGDPDWRAVAISASGWQITSQPPVRFRRSPGMLALPTPVRGGAISDLRPFINAASDDDFRLIVSWLIAALSPRGPYPALVLVGEQGSSKSTVARVLRDPNKAPLRSQPREERDLLVSAINSWCQTIDNISSLPVWLSDALCRLATGGGIAGRMLYTDDQEKILEAQRPALLTGIDDFVTRADLLDRSLLITLPVIRAKNRQREADFWRRFEAAAPRILGALLDALVVALRDSDKVELPERPRMADFAQWSVAAAPALGWSGADFLRVFADNRRDATRLALDGSPIAAVLIAFCARFAPWTGTATDLLRALNRDAEHEERQERSWPRSPKALANQVRRIAPNLRDVGIAATFERTNDASRTRLIVLRARTASGPSASSGASEAGADSDAVLPPAAEEDGASDAGGPDAGR